jgi:WD40 repeat protein
VTCGKDKTIRVWNYATKTLEICATMTEEALAVAFHPSGFHIIVALVDKILMVNVLSKSLNPFKTLPIKACREVKFSNGGHLFAAAVGTNNQIFVYNFYTGECPSYYNCKGHNGKVRCIDWFEDDMGFVSCGLDGSVYEYDLIVYKESQTRLADKDFTQKNVWMTSVVNIPGKQYEFFAVGNDRKIWHSKDNKNGYDAGVSLSQLCLTNN